jgi:hypothetical protein
LEDIHRMFPLLAYITFLMPILPIAVGLIRIGKIDKRYRLVTLLLVCGFLGDLFSRWPNQNAGLNPLPTHLFIIIEFVLVLTFVVSWQESKKARIFFIFILASYIVFWLAAKFTFEPFSEPYSYTGTISYSILALASGYTFFLTLSSHSRRLFEQGIFWILFSFIVTYIGSLLPVAIQAILVHYSKQDFELVWSIIWILNLASNILFTIGFLCPQKQT